MLDINNRASIENECVRIYGLPEELRQPFNLVTVEQDQNNSKFQCNGY